MMHYLVKKVLYCIFIVKWIGVLEPLDHPNPIYHIHYKIIVPFRKAKSFIQILSHSSYPN